MQKLKQKLILIVLLGVSIGGLILSTTQPAAADAFSIWTWVTKWTAQPLLDAVANILTIIFGGIAFLITAIGQLLLSAVFNTDPNFLLNDVATEATWYKILLLTNGVYLAVLIIASIAIIVRANVGTYNIKKVLGGLVTAVALSNLSLLIVRALVEFGQILTNSLSALFGINQDYYKIFLFKLLSETQPITHIGNQTEEIILIWVAFILVASIIIKLAVILFERMIWLFGLAIVAPLAFAVGLLPNMQNYSKQWWEHLIKWILVLPATLGLAGLSIYVMTNGGKNDVSFISVQITQLSSLFQRSPDGSVVINNELLRILAGLAILWLAGEAGKKMKLGVATGTIFKGISKGVTDTFTGKNAIGKFGKEQYYNTVYPEMVARSEKFKQFEGERLANVRGWKARVINPEGWKKVRKLDTQKKVDEATMGEQARNTKKLAQKKQPYENLKKQKAEMLKQYAVDQNGLLFSADGSAAPAQDQQKYQDVEKKLKAGEADYEKTDKRYKQEMTGLAWKVREVNKVIPLDQIPDFDTLKADIERAKSEGNIAKELSGFEQMSRIARTKNHPDSADAAQYMGSDKVDRMFEEAGINKEIFRSRAKPAQILRSMRENAPKNAHKDYIVAQADYQQKSAAFELKYKMPATKFNVQLEQAEDLHQDIIAQVGAHDLTNGDHLNKLINAITKAREANEDIKTDDDAIAHEALVHTPGLFNLDDAAELNRVKTINKLFNTKGKEDAVKLYTTINARVENQTVADLVSELNVVKKDMLKVQDAQQKVNILESDIETDYKSHKDSYEIVIRNKINEQVKASQSTPHPVTNIEVIQQQIVQHREANDALDIALKQYSGNENAKTVLDNLQRTNATTVNFDQIKGRLEKSGIGPITQNEWNNLTVGDVKNFTGRTFYALNHFDKSPKGGKQK